MGIVPVDVVTDGKDLFFILEKPAQIDFVRVRAAKAAPGSASKALWLLGYDAATPVKSRKYQKLGQLRYGRKYDGFSWVEGPFPLQKNVEYLVEINMPGKFAKEVFVITEKNTVTMPRPKFERQKTRGYEVSADKDGEKVFTAK
ncbi:MAG: hypothetical protein Q7R35_12735 [Elusimicrobiota bacterium]|nr:hypothetical protein [Elusimicrobiota bacterium]